MVPVTSPGYTQCISDIVREPSMCIFLADGYEICENWNSSLKYAQIFMAFRLLKVFCSFNYGFKSRNNLLFPTSL